MNDKFTGILSGLSLIIIATVISGCSDSSYEKQYYLLETQRISPIIPGDKQNIIEVRRFTIDPAFGAKGLTYRKSEFEYETDFYHEFIISPDMMITEKVRNWLSISGLFQRVLDVGSYVDPTHILEGSIIALYGDFRDKSSPKAVMEIRVFLLESKSGQDPTIVSGKTYRSTVNFDSADPRSLISALDRCLVEILTDLEQDLSKRLQ